MKNFKKNAKTHNKNAKNPHYVLNFSKKRNNNISSVNDIDKFADQIDELETMSYKNTERTENFAINKDKFNTAYNLSVENSGDIENIYSLIECNTTNISENTHNIQTNQDDISSLTGVLSQHTQQIEGISTDVFSLKISRDYLNGAVSNNQTNITNLQTQVSNLSSSKQDVLTAGDNITIQNNVISSTSNGGNVDLSAITTSIGTIQTTLVSQQSQINNLKALLMLAVEGINGAEQTFDQTLEYLFDEYDRDLEITGALEVVCPNVLVACNSNLTKTDATTGETEQAIYDGIVSATISYNISSATNITFQLFDDSTMIASTSKSLTSSDVGLTLNVIIKAKQGFSAPNHNYYVVATTTTSNSLTIIHQNIQIVAPEPRVLNKISPFEVSYNYYTNKYYFSDCSSGIAMVAEIDADNFTSINDIVWTNTGVEAQNYKVCFLGATDNTTSDIGKKYAIIIRKNNRIKIFDCDDPTIFYNFPVGTFSVSALPTKHNYHMMYFLCYIKNTLTGYYFCLNENLTFKKQATISYLSNLANIEAHRSNLAYLAYSSSWLANYCTCKNGDGQFNINYSSTTNYCIVNKIQKYHMYMKQMNSSSSFLYILLYKLNGKFYRRIINYFGSNTMFSNNPILIGEYDDVFLAKDNTSYFAVENGKLIYINNA